MFKNVIVKRPCSKITEGITSAPELGKPDYELALKQHDAYIEALKSCGVEVTVLDADENFPDSCFFGDLIDLHTNFSGPHINSGKGFVRHANPPYST